MLGRPRGRYCQVLLCMQNRRSMASMISSPLCLHQLRIKSSRCKFLEKPYSPVIDSIQLRTGFIDFPAALSSLDHHELFHHQYSHYGIVKFSCPSKIEDELFHHQYSHSGSVKFSCGCKIEDELFHNQYSHYGSVKFSFICKIEGVWRAWSPVLISLSAWINPSWAPGMTYRPIIENVQLRTGFIDILAVLSLDRHELFYHRYSHKSIEFACACRIGGVWRAWFPVLYLSAWWPM